MSEQGDPNGPDIGSLHEDYYVIPDEEDLDNPHDPTPIEWDDPEAEEEDE